jgi:dihydrodipicolinate synthase/N-acetylneuraminate lyase
MMRTAPHVMPAIITPFAPDGDLDVAAHAHNVAVLAAAGIEGFVIGGSNGEGPYLEAGERRALAESTRRAAPNAYVLVGLAAESLRAAASMATEAADGGADAVLGMTPTTLVRHRPDLVAGYYRDLAEASPLPVFLYSVPRVTAYDLPLDVAADLASHANIAGIKDSSGDLERATSLASTPASFLVFVGSSAIATSGIAAGAHGAITASANYAAHLVLGVATAARRGGDEAAQMRLGALAAAVEAHGVPGVKYAAGRLGLRPGSARLPLRAPGPDARHAIDAALEEAGLQ